MRKFNVSKIYKNVYSRITKEKYYVYCNKVCKIA